MTAPGTDTPSRGRPSAFADRHRVLVLWSLLLVGLLSALPCAGTARAVGSAHALPTARAVPSADRADTVPAHRTDRDDHGRTGTADAAVQRERGPSVRCTDDERPAPGKGCSSHAFCGPESQLPNAPPQPGAVALPQLIAPAALPDGPRFEVLAGPDHAPDLHVLQVQRS